MVIFRAIKEVVVEVFCGIFSPSKTYAPSLAVTKIGKKFYEKKLSELLFSWKKFIEEIEEVEEKRMKDV